MQLQSVLVVMVLAACGSKASPAPQLGNSPPAASAPESRMPAPSGLAAQWIAKLDDPGESERAVTELERIGNPSAIEPLGRHWKEQGRPVRVLQVMISLARPLTPDDAKALFITDYEATGRPASWDPLLPFLRAALTSIALGDPRSVDNATKAAQAIGDARLAAALPDLIGLALTYPTRKSISPQIAAIRAIGAIGGAEATKTLLTLIARDPPAHPRTANAVTSRDDRRKLEEAFGLHLAVTGAAINAVGVLPSREAGEILIKQIYVTPELAMQLRRALVANGPLVIEPLRSILRGTHDGVNQLIKERKLDRYCGDAGELPAAKCKPVSIRDFYAAMILGDLHDEGSVPDLIEALKRPAVPYYYLEDQAGPNTQHHALFDALRKLFAEEAATSTKAVWKDPKLDVTLRTLAISAYPYLARTDAAVGELYKIAADNTADDGMRQEAATAVARMSRDQGDIELMLRLASRYTDAAAKKRKAAEAAWPGQTTADATLAKAQDAAQDAKAKLLQVANDPAATTRQIKAGTAATRKADEAFRAAKKKHRDQSAGYRVLDQAATAYTSYARMFQTHVARIEIAFHCKNAFRCLMQTLLRPQEEELARIQRYIPDVDTWTSDEKQGLRDAAIERAMIELAKRGRQPAIVTELLLDRLDLRQRATAQAILLALPRIAKRPCPTCATELAAAIARGGDEPSIEATAAEATLLKSYFTWAK